MTSENSNDPFDQVVFIHNTLDGWYDQISHALPKIVNFQNKLIEFATYIQKICDNDDYFVFGCLQGMKGMSYSIKHSIQTAIVSDMIARQLGLDESRRLYLICAALTMNISIKRLQDVLYAQEERPYEQQRSLLYNHPQESSNVLGKLGIDKEEIISTIEQHHESINGKGYPNGIKKVLLESRIINITDRYMAGISARSYRNALLPQRIIKRLYNEKKDSDDKGLVLCLAKSLGIYPPGTYVRLKNEELGVVVYHSEVEIDKPVVYIVQRANGSITNTPIRRNPNIEEHRIKEAVLPDNFSIGVNPYILWGYSVFNKNEDHSRRKSARVDVKFPAKLMNMDISTLEACKCTVINLSEGGFSFYVNEKTDIVIEIDNYYYTTVTIDGKELVDIYIKVRHSRKTSSGVVVYGASFEKINSFTLGFIKEYIENAIGMIYIEKKTHP